MLITNATIITWEDNNRILKDSAIAIHADKIVEIGPNQEIIEKYPNEKILDAR